MKTLNQLAAVLVVLSLSFFVTSCKKDKIDPLDTDPIIEPIVLDCSMQGTAIFLAKDSTFTLVDRGEGVDYIVNCYLQVRGDLTIQPGVTIQFGSKGGIRVLDGSFQAIGTSDKPITFTGEDKVPGSWGHIVLRTDDIKNKMQHCIVEYAGSFAVSSNGDKGNVIVMQAARLEMQDCIIRHGQEYGVKVLSNTSKLPVFKNNKISTCKYPVRIPALLVPNMSGGEYTGNTNDVILVEGHVLAVDPGETSVWKNLKVPYRIARKLDVYDGVLQIMPGCTLEFLSDMGIVVGDNQAALVANGTAAEPILFTGVIKTSGYWKNLYFDSRSASNSISYATIEYAGSGKGAIDMWAKARLTVDHVDFKNNASCAFHEEASGAAQVVNPNLTWSNLTFDGITNNQNQTDQSAFPGGLFSYCH